jgi:branched-chain amino acid transport system ATP-binding protein
MSGEVILSAVDVARHFGGFKALDGVSLELERGQIHAIIGPNGAGKSTFLNCLSGLLVPTRGDVLFEGRRITAVPPHARARLGMARSFQITSIFTGLAVGENVQLALMAQRGDCRSAFSLAGRRHWDEAIGLLEAVGIAAMAERPSAELSAGDRKRLEFAIALAGRPKVLLLDEPTAGMSGAERAIVIDIMRRLASDSGIGVLFTEHDIDMVFENADCITVLHQGRPLTFGTPQEVRRDPKVQEVYLGEGHDA